MFCLAVLETGLSVRVIDDVLTAGDDYHDYAIWTSIASSMKQWRESKQNQLKLKHKINKRMIFPRHRNRRDEEEVCYGKFGCFRDEGPFDYLDTLPASPEAIGTVFTLFTRKSPSLGENLDYLDSNYLRKSSFKPRQPVKIIIHGFGSSGRRPWVLQMTEALLHLDNFNVIIVDWEKGAALPNYVQAAANTRLVGKQIAVLLQMLNQEKGVKPKDVHMIGFSLGAHIAGFTGSEIRNISRITGLDPAAPLFEGYSEKVRLDPTDAEFVDVLHTNGNSFMRGGLGSVLQMGHIDFYPNGGREQVGCNSVFVGAITDIFYGNWQSLCHHRRAFRFFIDSMNPQCNFHAFACESYEKFLRGQCFDCGKDGKLCANMGYFADKSSARGRMYLVTRDTEPFCANQYKIAIRNRIRQGSTWGKLEMEIHAKDANETFQLTNESDEVKESSLIQGLVVAHPKLRNITHVIMKYYKYRGWIYSGKDYWAIEKIALTNSDGESVSFCGHNTVLEDNLPLHVNLYPGNCTVHIPHPSLPSARVARLVWEVISDPVSGQPPKVFWRLAAVDPYTSKEFAVREELHY